MDILIAVFVVAVVGLVVIGYILAVSLNDALNEKNVPAEHNFTRLKIKGEL